MRSLVELPKAPPQPLLVPHRETAAGDLARFQVSLAIDPKNDRARAMLDVLR